MKGASMENLTSPRVIRDILARFGLDAKKSFGQNFLIDANILAKIAGAAQLTPEDLVLEIGPGLGTLTQALASRAGKVMAFESDYDLLPVLQYTLAEFAERVTVKPGNFLKADLKKLWPQDGFRNVKVVANVPYYITTPILMYLLESGIPFQRMVFLMQREAADRVIACPGHKNYGALSVLVQFYYVPEIVADVPPTVFMPAPKVQSVILRLLLPAQARATVKDAGVLSQLVRTGFAQRRKTMINAVQNSGLWQFNRTTWTDIFEKAGVHPQARAEMLSVHQFAVLADAVVEAMADADAMADAKVNVEADANVDAVHDSGTNL